MTARRTGTATATPNVAALAEQTVHDALVEHMAKRIRWAMHTGNLANATVVAEEFAEQFERVLADGS